ncbi:unnamed protein product [Danaus chrysippus]|uniref:(African queen) hypothetical protein n=1 Tax=Danaus chrysippus TaxID=151541 RepID=A0A8J2VXH4_9NEOP|nr:unnamed protein product [Danaus chrysippus]
MRDLYACALFWSRWLVAHSTANRRVTWPPPEGWGAIVPSPLRRPPPQPPQPLLAPLPRRPALEHPDSRILAPRREVRSRGGGDVGRRSHHALVHGRDVGTESCRR